MAQPVAIIIVYPRGNRSCVDTLKLYNGGYRTMCLPTILTNVNLPCHELAMTSSATTHFNFQRKQGNIANPYAQTLDCIYLTI